MTRRYGEIWLVDYEYYAPDGERPRVICGVFHEVYSGVTQRLWYDVLDRRRVSPVPTHRGAAFVSYFATAELSVHLAHGWQMPASVTDFYGEFRLLTNGLSRPYGSGLVGALRHFGLDHMGIDLKDHYRALAMRGPPYSLAEKEALLDYCESDVMGLRRLFDKLWPHIQQDQAWLRGRYLRAVAQMEHCGIPVDVESLSLLREHWDDIKSQLITHMDDFELYEDDHFRMARLEQLVANKGYLWPRTRTGRLSTDDDTVAELAGIYPELQPLRELRGALGRLKLSGLTVGEDGRNRCMLSPFQSKTSRNLPSSNKYLFGPSKWVRSLMQPHEGYALVYVDWQSAEIGIAAACSGRCYIAERLFQ